MSRQEEIRNAIDMIFPIPPSEKGRKYEQALMATGFEEGVKWADSHPKSHGYRIKPKPKYRPFKNQEECWEEMQKHPDFGWIKINVTSGYEQIVRIFDYCKTELSFNIANSDDDYTSEMMLNSYTFTDGTPFGVKEE